MAQERELLIYPCAYRGEKGAEQSQQAEEVGCPADGQSSVSPTPHLKEIQITNTTKLHPPPFSLLPQKLARI